MSFEKSESKMDYSSMMDHSADIDSEHDESQALAKMTVSFLN